MKFDYAKAIINKINFLLKQTNKGFLNTQKLFFVMDEDVNYEKEGTVNKEKLIYPIKANEFLEPILINGPSWIHASLISTTKNFNLITIRFGALVGNNDPSINMSLETNFKATVI